MCLGFTSLYPSFNPLPADLRWGWSIWRSIHFVQNRLRAWCYQHCASQLVRCFWVSKPHLYSTKHMHAWGFYLCLQDQILYQRPENLTVFKQCLSFSCGLHFFSSGAVPFSQFGLFIALVFTLHLFQSFLVVLSAPSVSLSFHSSPSFWSCCQLESPHLFTSPGVAQDLEQVVY